MSNRLHYSRSERFPEYLIHGAADAIVPVVSDPDGVTPETEEKAKQTARRLTACWNSLIGAPTELIEIATTALPELPYSTLLEQRDALLKDLERARSLLAVSEGQFKGDFQNRVRAFITQARTTIAMVTGEPA